MRFHNNFKEFSWLENSHLVLGLRGPWRDIVTEATVKKNCYCRALLNKNAEVVISCRQGKMQRRTPKIALDPLFLQSCQKLLQND